MVHINDNGSICMDPSMSIVHIKQNIIKSISTSENLHNTGSTIRELCLFRDDVLETCLHVNDVSNLIFELCTMQFVFVASYHLLLCTICLTYCTPHIIVLCS